MKKTVNALLYGKIDVGIEKQKPSIDDNNPLAELNAFNWSYKLYFDKKKRSFFTLSDLDSILINMKIQELQINPLASPMVLLPYITINAQKMVGRFVDKPDQDLILVRTKTNNRERSQESSRKDDGDEMDICKNQKGQFTKEPGEYGFTWAKMVRGDEDALPSMNEILDGLKYYYLQQIDEMTEGQSYYRIKYVKYQLQLVFRKLRELVKIEKPDEPLIISKYSDNGLCNPDSSAVCLLLWLYSIEPPFYAAINEAGRIMDTEFISMLGPFAKAIYIIFEYVEFQREDRLDCGNQIIKQNP